MTLTGTKLNHYKMKVLERLKENLTEMTCNKQERIESNGEGRFQKIWVVERKISEEQKKDEHFK